MCRVNFPEEMHFEDFFFLSYTGALGGLDYVIFI